MPFAINNITTSPLARRGGGVNKDFIIKVDTTKAGSANDTMIIPTDGSGYDCTVDWGDGNSNNYSGTPGLTTIQHTYDTGGEKTITISGTFPTIFFNSAGDRLKLLEIINLGDVGWTTFFVSFSGCENLVTFGGYGNTSNVTDMSFMFRDCSTFNSDISNLDTSKVTDMRYMFNGCHVFNQPVSNFNTSKVTNMSYMFTDCDAFNQPVSNFDTSKVTNMSNMFDGCDVFNQSVSNFDTSLVEDMTRMFYLCRGFKQSLASFNMTSVTTITNMCRSTDINEEGTTTNYDDTLVAWELQDLVNGLAAHFGDAEYSSTGEAAKNDIMTDDLWSFTDGGLAT